MDLLKRAELTNDNDERQRILGYLHAVECICIQMDWLDLDNRIVKRRELLQKVNP